MFAIGIRYLNGFAVASEPDHRDRPEWPPHPGRVFMALAAAYFQTGKPPQERAALEWLESQPAPQVSSPEATVRSVVTHYVPVADKAGDAQNPPTAIIQSAPALARDRQPRTFPRAQLDDDTVYLLWPEAEPSEEHRTALDALCSKVTRIGHSISLVQMWVCDRSETIEPKWIPDEDRAEIRLRVAGAGTLEDLERRFNAEACELYGRLCLEAEDETRTKAERKAARQTLKDSFGNQPPLRLRPVLPLYQGYARLTAADTEPPVPGSVFSPHLLVWSLERLDGPYYELDLACTLAVTDRWREALRVNAENASSVVLCLVSGHAESGEALREPHIAYLPLAFVGHEHADGHLVGVAMALPADLSRQVRRELLGVIASVDELKLGRLGRWRLVRETSERPPWSLTPQAWTGRQNGATHWATVTPVAFDRHPKAKDKAAYQRQCADMIANGCEAIGLPRPRGVALTAVSAHLGAPPAFAFPRLVRKDGSERRHTHAILTFDQPVRGPVIIGAGRYRGYGFCRPLDQGSG